MYGWRSLRNFQLLLFISFVLNFSKIIIYFIWVYWNRRFFRFINVVTIIQCTGYCWGSWSLYHFYYFTQGIMQLVEEGIIILLSFYNYYYFDVVLYTFDSPHSSESFPCQSYTSTLLSSSTPFKKVGEFPFLVLALVT